MVGDQYPCSKNGGQTRRWWPINILVLRMGVRPGDGGRSISLFEEWGSDQEKVAINILVRRMGVRPGDGGRSIALFEEWGSDQEMVADQYPC